MQIYALADLTASPVPGKTWTLGNQTVGVVITNYSNIGFNLSSDTQANIGTLPPYNTITIPATPGEVVSFAPSTITTTALPMADMFVNLAESSTAVTPNLTALALAPGYVQNVTGTVEFAAGQQVAIQGTPTVAFAAGQTVDIGNVPSVAISSGTVNANISNAEIPANVVNAQLSINPFLQVATATFTNVTVPASGTLACGLSIPSTIPNSLGYFDSGWLYIKSSNGNLGNLSLILNELNLARYGLIITTPNTNLNYLGHNNQIGLTSMFQLGTTPFDQIIFTLQNLTAAAITDTFELVFYAKYASQNVINTPANPVNVQNINQNVVYLNYSATTTPYTIISTGGMLYLMTFAISNIGSSSIQVLLQNNGNTFWASSVAAGATIENIVLDFKHGIANNGITIITNSGTGGITGYAITS